MARKYHQGLFTPKYPEKYVGNVNNIVYRSSWEKQFMLWCDNNPNVLKYASEEMVVPYISPIDNRQHRYFVDFVIMVKTKQNVIRKYAVEIKPHSQTEKPKSKNKKRLLEESMTYAVNQAKWEAAHQYCKKMGIEFIVLTEKHLKV